jgi:hypothetical protein
LAGRCTEGSSTQEISSDLCFINPMTPTGYDLIAPFLRKEVANGLHSCMWQAAEGIAIEITEIRVGDNEFTSVIG